VLAEVRDHQPLHQREVWHLAARSRLRARSPLRHPLGLILLLDCPPRLLARLLPLRLLARAAHPPLLPFLRRLRTSPFDENRFRRSLPRFWRRWL
jgi:hypothetical protein